MLVHIKEIIKKAVAGKYAVGAFNVNNLEILQAVLRAAEKLRSPVIVQTTEGAIEYAGLAELAGMVKAGAENINVPVALHLDHGKNFDLVKKCVQAGYSSIMIDASDKPLPENIRQTRKIVQYCHRKNVCVQAELGRLEGVEDWLKVNKNEEFLTDPRKAREFVEQTKIDFFAPAVGNYHGVLKLVNKKRLRLDLKRLAEIAKMVKIPFVLHGASGFPDAQIKKAIALGVRVINIDSELRVSFARAERKFLMENKDVFDPRKILNPATAAMQKVVEKKIRVFGSRNMA